MRKLIGTSLLALALSCATYAGDMPFPTPPQPAGNIPFGVTAERAEEIAGAQRVDEAATLEAALNLLQGVLTLF